MVFLFLWTFPLLGSLPLVLAPLILVPALFGAVLGRIILLVSILLPVFQTMSWAKRLANGGPLGS